MREKQSKRVDIVFLVVFALLWCAMLIRVGHEAYDTYRFRKTLTASIHKHDQETQSNFQAKRQAGKAHLEITHYGDFIFYDAENQIIGTLTIVDDHYVLQWEQTASASAFAKALLNVETLQER